ncbi:MAG: tetratricopeptide repeat protein, partial [Pseudonocardiaceae bacterium]
LLALGLIAPLPAADSDDDTEHYLVHRWTAAALTKYTDTAQLIDAHRRAAQFWQWRVNVWPQDRTVDIQHLVEARYHHHHAHDLDNAITVTEQICKQLHTWCAWTWEEDLCTETLTWLAPRSHANAKFTHQLGIIAQSRGDYAQAEQRYQTSLTLNEELGDRSGIASSYNQLGTIAQSRGNYAQAEQRYQTALTLNDELGDRARIASNYHNLGTIAQKRGDYTQAEQRYQTALTLNEELGNRAGIASSTSRLGVLRTEQGRPAEGIPYTISALAIRLELESPEVSTDIFWLARQRQEVGEEGFIEILSNLLDADNVQFVIDAVNTMESPPGAPGS